MNFLEDFLKNLPSDTINNIFGITLISVFLLGFLFFVITQKIAKKGFLANFSETAPTLLTSLGILGTFTGIVTGLLNFDISDINNSVSELLAGMKTAFLTSVIGVGLSILLKFFYNFRSERSKKEEDQLDIENVIANFYEQTDLAKTQNSVLDQILTTLNHHNENTLSLTKSIQKITENHLQKNEHLEEFQQSLLQQLSQQNTDISTMVKALGDDSEGSVIGQVKLLRSDLSDQHKILKDSVAPLSQQLQHIDDSLAEQKSQFVLFQQTLWEKLNTFAEMLSKSATEQVIEALKLVIVEFNEKITEQFGDNFKQLNIAVGQLVEWQENYKQQLIEMMKLYETGVNTLSHTEKSIQNIEQSTNNIPVTMNDLSQIIQVNQHQLTELNSHLSAFAELKENAVKAVPQIQENIQLMLGNLANANDELINTMKSNAILLADSMTKSTTQFETSTQQVNTILVDNANTLMNKNAQVSEHLQNTIQLLSDKHTEFNNQLTEASSALRQNTEKWQSEFEKTIHHTQKHLGESFEKLMNTQISENTHLMQKLVQEGEHTLKTTQESVKQQLKLIDDSMQTELTRVMKEMGTALATITNRFTQDYQKLVNEMSKITQYRR